MIARLSGTLVEKELGQAVIDCGGVGYLVNVSAHTWAQLPAEGSDVVLRIFTQASENRLSLHGFATTMERELFDLLITVKNVGPSSAMAMLSGGANPAELAQLIAQKKTSGLIKLKGVGKKTAEMLVVELHEKCQVLLTAWGKPSGEVQAGPHYGEPLNDVRAEVVTALVQLGWKQTEATAAAADLTIAADATLEALLREALRGMQR